MKWNEMTLTRNRNGWKQQAKNANIKNWKKTRKKCSEEKRKKLIIITLWCARTSQCFFCSFFVPQRLVFYFSSFWLESFGNRNKNRENIKCIRTAESYDQRLQNEYITASNGCSNKISPKWILLIAIIQETRIRLEFNVKTYVFALHTLHNLPP